MIKHIPIQYWESIYPIPFYATLTYLGNGQLIAINDVPVKKDKKGRPYTVRIINNHLKDTLNQLGRPTKKLENWSLTEVEE